MATLEELVVSLTAETSSLRAEMSKAVKSTEDATSKMDEAIAAFSESSSKNVSFFESSMATMAGVLGSELVLGAFEKVKEIVGELINQFGEGVKAAAEEQDAFQKLANSLALVGHYSTEAMAGLQDFAEEVEKTTGIDNSLVAANLALLSSLTKLNSEGLKKAQTVAIDLAASLGMDLNSATMLVAKGISNSTDVFKRYGLHIDDAGTKAGRLANITTALAGQQGAAAGATNTYNGAVKLLGVAYEDFLKVLGKWVTDNPAVIALIKATTTEIQGLTKSAEGAETPMQAIAIVLLAVAESSKILVDVLGFIIDHIKILGAGFEALNVLVEAFFDTLEGVVNSVYKLGAGVYALITGNDELAKSIETTGQAFGTIDFANTERAFTSLVDTVNSKASFGELSDSLGRIADAGATAFYKIDAGAKVAAPSVKGAAAAVRELTEAEVLHEAAVKSFAEALVQQGNDINAHYTAQQTELEADLANDLVTRDQYWSLRKQQLTTQYTEEQALLDNARAQNKITEEQYLQATQQLSRNEFDARKKMGQDKLNYDKNVNKQTLSATGDLFGALAVLQESSSKELVAVGKAAAIAQATISAYLAITNALATVPYPANYIAAAAIGIQAFAQVAKISGIGFAKGGEVPGSGTRDSVPAVLTPGENVVDRSTNRKLNSFLDGSGSGGGGPQVSITVSLAGATIIGDLKSAEFGAATVQAINEAVARGMALPILGTGS